MSNETIRLLRESLDPSLNPVDVAQRVDRAYGLFVSGDKQVLGLIAYGFVADVQSSGAFHSGASSSHSNPRLRRFQDRFEHVAEMTGVQANWD